MIFKNLLLVDNKLFLNLKNRLDSLTGNNLLKLQDIETNDILKKDSYLIKPLVKKNKLQLAIDQDKQSETNTQEKVSIPKFHNPKALVTLLKKKTPKPEVQNISDFYKIEIKKLNESR